MSDQGDKTCPLCAEEMDMTDQQLKPCKCGYEICVWCWHQIMDMAEKDEIEGRCPACRTPYNKEKIVGTTASCGRRVSEINVEKKKPHKGRSKTSEGRKQLASVRVIQRNLVYIVGLPLNFADENVLQRKEYFGQYGKVLKVSISRTAAGAIQHFANSTCSLYITYSKEEEAVRCIQSVHGFVLDGKPLRACFGTTKYCHAWLRNMPCSNPECLYLHESGSQEDSFTKDEIISAHTRSRVQQIAGSSNKAQQHSGTVLPPPVDEYCNNITSSVKTITKTAVATNQNSAVNTRVSPPNSSSGRSVVLPVGASWGSRASNNQSLPGITHCSDGPLKRKSDTCGQVTCSTVAASPGHSCSQQSDAGKLLVPNNESAVSQDKSQTGITHCSDGRHKQKSDGCSGPSACSTPAASLGHPSSQQSYAGDWLVPNEESTVCKDKSQTGTSEPLKEVSDSEKRISVSESSVFVHSVSSPENRFSEVPPSAKLPPNSTSIVDFTLTNNEMASDNDSGNTTDEDIANICSNISSMGVHKNQILENCYGQHDKLLETSQMTGTSENTSEEASLSDVQQDFISELPAQVMRVDLPETEELLSFEKQRLKDLEVATNRTSEFSHAHHLSEHLNFHSSQCNNADGLVDLDRQFAKRSDNLINSIPNVPSRYTETAVKIHDVNDVEYSDIFPGKEKRSLPRGCNGETFSVASDTGESSIISNILSMDFDSWDNPLTSSQNLAKLLGVTDKSHGSLGVSGSVNVQNSNQSRFSFAREEEPTKKVFKYSERGYRQHMLGVDYSTRNGLQLEKLVSSSGFPVTGDMESGIIPGGHFHGSSNRLSGSRSHISAPPGFSVSNRAPPPGFTSHERMEHNFDEVSGNHMLDASSLRNHYRTPYGVPNAINDVDIEFIDPAILAVGKGVLPGGINSPGADLRSSSSQLSTYEEVRFQSLLRRSLPPRQSQRFMEPRDSYPPIGDVYGIPSSNMEQLLTSNCSPLAQFTHPPSRNGITYNAQWDCWNEIQSGSNSSMAELLRNEKLELNKFYGGYEDSKIHMPSSGNLYNRTYGI